MTGFARYLDPKAVVFLQTTDRDEALQLLINRLVDIKTLNDPKEFQQAILAREKIVSTGIGMGLAIPHAKLPGYKDFFLAIGVQQDQGIPWNSLDGAPVRLIFMIGGPEDKQTEYLQLLSALTTALKSADRRKKLLLSQSAEELIATLKD